MKNGRIFLSRDGKRTPPNIKLIGINEGASIAKGKSLYYSHPGAAMSWIESVVHSQGTLQAQRRQFIQEELVRVHTYQNKGDLARFEDVLDYLNRRDT